MLAIIPLYAQTGTNQELNPIPQILNQNINSVDSSALPILIYPVLQKPEKKEAIPAFDIIKNKQEGQLSNSNDSIDRSYYINNPFDIDDSNNPFNLPRNGSFNKFGRKEKDNQQIDKFFKELFAYKSAPKKTVSNRKPPVVAPIWLLFTLLLLLSFYSYVLVVYRKEVFKTLQAFKNISWTIQPFREQKNIFTPYSLFSSSLYILSIGHFVFVAINLWLTRFEQEQDWRFSMLLFCILIVLLLFIVKQGQVKIFGLIYPVGQQMDYYNFVISNNSRVCGLFLTPILFLMVYPPDVIKYFVMYTLLAILAALYLFRYIKSGIASSKIITSNKLHFFIYLCSVEIAPVIIILKFLTII
jgi:hypothetical protein